MSAPGGHSNGLPFSKSNSREQEELLLQPILHVMQKSGKNVRKKLLLAFNLWMRADVTVVDMVGDIVQLLHNASLLVDDIQDSSVLRRGIPCAHKIYGVPSTINAGNYAYFIGLERVLELGHPDAVGIFSEQLLELHRGQGMEIYWRDNFQCPTEEEYKLMTIRKTGGLFNLAIRLMNLFSGSADVKADAADAKVDAAKAGADVKADDATAKRDYVPLTSLLGLYFQVRDDYANLCLDEYAENKSFAEDLTEGKFSFPILHAIRTDPADTKIISILRQRTQEVGVKKYCVDLLREKGSFDYTLATLRDLDRKAREEIQNLGGNDLLIGLLDELKNWEPKA